MECPNCKSIINEGSKFCNNCGSAITTDIICSKCNAINSSGSKFCKDCGTPLLVSGQETKQEQSSTPPLVPEQEINQGNSIWSTILEIGQNLAPWIISIFTPKTKGKNTFNTRTKKRSR